MGIKFERPRAKVPFCWICDKLLYAGGRSYTMIVEDGIQHPAHKECAKRPGVEVATIEESS